MVLQEEQEEEEEEERSVFLLVRPISLWGVACNFRSWEGSSSSSSSSLASHSRSSNWVCSPSSSSYNSSSRLMVDNSNFIRRSRPRISDPSKS